MTATSSNKSLAPHIRANFPIPPHAVLAFVEARRRLVAITMQRLGASYVTPEVLDTLH